MTTPDAPAWFRDALAAPREARTVEVEGVPIRYHRWGDPSRPGLVLVHGGSAHAHWWTFLAPMLAAHHHVVALDLSGHGDSGHRETYPRETWVAEVLAVIADAGIVGPPVLIGHSMGGLVSIVAASMHGEQLAGAIIVDSPVHRADPESERGHYEHPARGHRVYPDVETGISRFRLIPDQPCDNPFIMDWVARNSLHEVEGGWTWKFDVRIFKHVPLYIADYLASVRCRVALIRGERSLVVPPETAADMVEILGRNAPLVEIPLAHHHLILDQPLPFIAAVRALLADWEHSVPRRAPPGATRPGPDPA